MAGICNIRMYPAGKPRLLVQARLKQRGKAMNHDHEAGGRTRRPNPIWNQYPRVSQRSQHGWGRGKKTDLRDGEKSTSTKLSSMYIGGSSNGIWIYGCQMGEGHITSIHYRASGCTFSSLVNTLTSVQLTKHALRFPFEIQMSKTRFDACIDRSMISRTEITNRHCHFE